MDVLILLTGPSADLLVSLARDLAQNAVTAGTGVTGSLAITADAEHALLTGQSYTAVQLLASVLGIALDDAPAGPGTPVPAPGKTLVGASLSPDRARIGDRVTVSAAGFAPGERVTATIYSDPVVLGTVTASASGFATLAFRVPAGVDLGAHSVQLEGANQVAAARLTVLAAVGSGPLAVTGADVWLALMLALALLATGATALLSRRRQPSPRPLSLPPAPPVG